MLTFQTTSPSQTDPLRYLIIPTPWAVLGVVAAGTLLRHTLWACSRQQAKTELGRLSKEPIKLDRAMLPELQRAVGDYVAGKSSTFDCKCDISWATPFAQKVLRACSQIKTGDTMTYGELARLSGSSGGGRAVGAVMAANRIPLIIPCHRVIAADGTLKGYSAIPGPRLKEELLKHEKCHYGSDIGGQGGICD